MMKRTISQASNYSFHSSLASSDAYTGEEDAWDSASDSEDPNKRASSFATFVPVGAGKSTSTTSKPLAVPMSKRTTSSRSAAGVNTSTPSTGESGASNSSSSTLAFSYTHVSAPDPSSYPPKRDMPGRAPSTTRPQVPKGAAAKEPGLGSGSSPEDISGAQEDEEDTAIRGRGWGAAPSDSRDVPGGAGPKQGWTIVRGRSADRTQVLLEGDEEGEMMIVGDMDSLDLAGSVTSMDDDEEDSILRDVGGRTRIQSEAKELIRPEAESIVQDPLSGIKSPRRRIPGVSSPSTSNPASRASSAAPATFATSRSRSTSRQPSRAATGSSSSSPPADPYAAYTPLSTEPTSKSGRPHMRHQSTEKLARERSIKSNRKHKFIECLSSRDISMNQLRKLAWAGIPPELRPMAWQILLGYLPLASDSRVSTLARKRNEYQSMVEATFARGREGLDQQIWHQIEIDVPRTRPGVPLWMFEVTQRCLERILYVWAIRHPASGYVQGINDLVTPFFQVFMSAYIDADPESFDPGLLPKNVVDAVEADSFWCLSRLLDGIQDNYIFAQPGIQRSVRRMQELVGRIDAPLAAHLESQNVEFMQFAFRWMNCLLMREISVQNTIRMWDTYLAEGTDAFSQFHLYVCCAFLVKWSEKLKTMDFQGIIMFLQSLPTQGWSDHEIEMLLSEAFLLNSIWHNAQSHFGGK